MGDFLSFQPGASLVSDLGWQSSLFLVAGLAASVALSRRPARAHLVLLLAIVGSLLAPLGSQLVHRAGWGLAFAQAPAAPLSLTTAVSEGPVQAVVGSRDGSEHGRVSLQVPEAAQRLGRGESRVEAGRSGSAWRLVSRDWVSIGLSSFLSDLWCVLSGLCLARLIVSLVMGRRAVGRARAITGTSMERAVAVACTRLGLRVRPDLRSFSQVDCPAIWCWGHRPVIVLPQHHDAVASVDWAAVFCHELAHWTRRDHVSSLLAEVLVCALPWHPLAWLARHRLGQLSELACDDWAVACGQEPAAYAETLLRLVPARRMLPALAAMSRRSGLAGRITHLLALNGPVEPRPGRGWSGGVLLAAIGLVAAIALAQAREGRARWDEAKKPGPASQLAASRPEAHPVIRRTVSGSVRDISGKPVAGASVFAMGLLEIRKRANGWYFTHHGEEQQTLGRTSSDRDGKFVLNLALAPPVVDVDVIAQSPGLGLTARNYSARPRGNGDMFFQVLDDRPVELMFLPNLPIEGRLLSQTGRPVSGVRVALAVLELGENPDGFALSAPTDSEGRPVKTPYWPEPVVTGAEGRFRLDGLSEKGVARLTFIHDAYIHEQLVISTESELSGYRRAWQTKAVPPRFTHVLETARPIEGIVSDNETGRPLAGIRVEIGATAAEPALPFHFPATTDAQGRYHITGIAWNYRRGLHAQLLPDAITGYFPTQHQHEEWPAGAAELRWNLTLKKGALVHGRVIDADSKQPIPGAQVAGEVFNQTVLTDERGNFSLCVQPNYRSLFVEGPTRDYRRVTVPHGEVESTGGVYHPHGYARITVRPDGTIAPVEVALKKGATIAAQAVDPDGKPLRDVWVSGESLFAESQHSGAGSGRSSLGLFRAASFEPGQICRAFFFHDERRLAGFADLTARPEPTEPVNVTLRGTARVRGKLLGPDGMPDRRAGVSAYLLLSPNEVKLAPMDFLRGDRVLSYGTAARRGDLTLTNTDEKGEFEVSDLMAGARNYLAFWPLTSKEVHYISIDPLQPGEVRDFGAVKPVVLTEHQP
jgi:beta-lactamase regulating signal transducer with metallopeptidase domain